jgi:hydroxymethylpyrimidine/phosphomethylpyrimidine kinase
MNGRVLIIAGSDSGGGAGIQADLKTVTALGGFAMTALTALTAQNTLGVHAIHEVPEAFITQQIEVVLNDFGADAIKLGMLHRASVIHAVADVLERLNPGAPIVLDPVMMAKGGQALLEPDAMQALIERLIPLATLVTPNVPEAEALSGIKISSVEDFSRAAEKIGGKAVLVKGGHMPGDVLYDVLWQAGNSHIFSGPKIDSPHTHGTGCTLASSIACGLAQGLDLLAAVERGRAYVLEAIKTAPGFGHGHGPLNHAHTVGKFP